MAEVVQISMPSFDWIVELERRVNGLDFRLAELDRRLKEVTVGLADRVAAQSELLTRKAEKDG